MNFLNVRIYSTDHNVGLRFGQFNAEYVNVLKKHIKSHQAEWNDLIEEWVISLDKVYLANIVASELGVRLNVESASKS